MIKVEDSEAYEITSALPAQLAKEFPNHFAMGGT